MIMIVEIITVLCLQRLTAALHFTYSVTEAMASSSSMKNLLEEYHRLAADTLLGDRY